MTTNTSPMSQDNVTAATNTVDGSVYNQVDHALNAQVDMLLSTGVGNLDKWNQGAVFGSFQSSALSTLAHALIDLSILGWNMSEEERLVDEQQRQETGQIPREQQYIERRVKDSKVLAEFAMAMVPASVRSTRADLCETVERAFEGRKAALIEGPKAREETADVFAALDEYDTSSMFSELDGVLAKSKREEIKAKLAEEQRAEWEAIAAVRDCVTHEFLAITDQLSKVAILDEETPEIEFTIGQARRIVNIVANKAFGRLEKMAEEYARYQAGDDKIRFKFTGRIGKATAAELMLLKDCEQMANDVTYEIDRYINAAAQTPINEGESNAVH